ncbi:MAG: phosphatase PAP2 family protein [Ignavibacteria bacterium]|nr:phosphatase PAP2 family protein [Ignavibacteria bacterium]
MGTKFHRALIICTILITQICFAQNQLNFKQFRAETEDFIKQPTKWQSKDWSIIGLTAASTLMIMQFDEDVRDQVLINRENINNLPAEFGRIWGDPFNTLLIGGVNALSGVVNNIYMNKKVAFEIYQSAIYTGLTTMLIKTILGRSRPYTNEGSYSFSPFNLTGDDEWSLPSGHTSLGFSLSTVLSENSKSDLMKYIYFIPAFLTAYSRVYQDKHWLSDVLLGAVIGYSIGKWTVKIHKKNEGPVNPIPQFSFFIKF